MVDITLKQPSAIRWGELEQGIKISEPGFITSGYDMRLVFIPANTTMKITEKDKVIVNLLDGKLSHPTIKEKQCTYLDKKEIIATEDSLLFLCFDKRDNKKMKDEIKGLPLQWIEPASGCFRTDPKIEVGHFRINLWYLIPNKNGGIHNHAEQQGHNINDPFIEFHTQLRGKGWMVKYKEQQENTEYERFELNQGDTHPLFSKVTKGKVSYPWHAYIASETGGLFIAFEDIVIS